MNASDLPEQDPVTGEWASPASPAVSAPLAWPPPPSTAAGPIHGLCIVPFTTMFLRIEGGVSDFRTGAIEVQQQGLSISGKAVPNSETQIPIMIVTVFLRLWLLAVLLMEYAFRKSKWQIVPWENIRQIGVVPNKYRVCLVFDAPNDKGVVKTFSLAFKLAPEQFEAFVNSVRPFIGDRLGEAKLIRWSSPAMVMLLTILAVGLVAIIAVAAMKFLQH